MTSRARYTASRWVGILVLFLFTLAGARGQKAESGQAKALAELKEKHREAVQKAVTPVHERYAFELETLLKRATFENDLDGAIAIQEELNRVRALLGDSPLVGEWEYRHNGRMYRRLILEGNGVELWREGKEWMRSEGKPWWPGFTWRPVNASTLHIFNDKGEKYLEWRLEGNDTVVQKDLESGKIVRLKRAAKPWK